MAVDGTKSLVRINSKVVSVLKTRRENVSNSYCTKVGHYILRFSGDDEIFLRLWNKVNYLRNSHYIPCTPIYLAGRMTPKEIKNTNSITASRVTKVDEGCWGIAPPNEISQRISLHSHFGGYPAGLNQSLEFFFITLAFINESLSVGLYMSHFLIFVLCRWGWPI
jgi:hypothetical protein